MLQGCTKDGPDLQRNDDIHSEGSNEVSKRMLCFFKIEVCLHCSDQCL